MTFQNLTLDWRVCDHGIYVVAKGNQPNSPTGIHLFFRKNNIPAGTRAYGWKRIRWSFDINQLYNDIQNGSRTLINGFPIPGFDPYLEVLHMFKDVIPYRAHLPIGRWQMIRHNEYTSPNDARYWP